LICFATPTTGDVVTETTAMAAEHVLSCQLHAADKHNQVLGGCVKLTRGALELLQRDLLSVETGLPVALPLVKRPALALSRSQRFALEPVDCAWLDQSHFRRGLRRGRRWV
jgi:hypothetical protein